LKNPLTFANDYSFDNTTQKNLFEYLDKVSAGEILVIQHNNQSIARLIPEKQTDWRDAVTHTLKLNETADELLKPLNHI